MSARSQKKDDFLGLYLPSDLKEEVRQRAETEEISISELVRRELKKTTRRDQVAAA